MKFTKENVERVFDKFMQGGDSFADLKERVMNLVDDTPEKVVVPKFVAEFYEGFEDATIYYLIAKFGGRDSSSELGKWYENCEGRHENGIANAQEVIAKMKLYGYEVEKEPLYYVANKEDYFILDKKLKRLSSALTTYNYRITPYDKIPDYFRLTEKEIKDYDERYWAFAVPVGDKHENNE